MVNLQDVQTLHGIRKVRMITMNEEMGEGKRRIPGTDYKLYTRIIDPNP